MLTIAAVTVTACRTFADPDDRPAWIAMPTPATHAELERAIRVLVGSTAIRISDDALTASHVLMLEPAIAEGLQGRTLGRNLERPLRLELVLTARGCYLVHVDSGTRARLRGVACVPAGTQ